MLYVTDLHDYKNTPKDRRNTGWPTKKLLERLNDDGTG